jgi:hypothetical protein
MDYWDPAPDRRVYAAGSGNLNGARVVQNITNSGLGAQNSA